MAVLRRLGGRDWHRLKIDEPRGMGPGFRQDDIIPAAPWKVTYADHLLALQLLPILV
jgi:hypothetical protein